MASRCAASLATARFLELERELWSDSEFDSVAVADRVYDLLCLVESDLCRADPELPEVMVDYGSWVLLHRVLIANRARVAEGLRFLRCHLRLMESPNINIRRLAKRAELKSRFLDIADASPTKVQSNHQPTKDQSKHQSNHQPTKDQSKHQSTKDQSKHRPMEIQIYRAKTAQEA
jgi:hypothetical protein